MQHKDRTEIKSERRRKREEEKCDRKKICILEIVIFQEIHQLETTYNMNEDKSVSVSVC